jgi:cation diffusion facilitator CzcD-associated flavoprotein CzcO
LKGHGNKAIDLSFGTVAGFARAVTAAPRGPRLTRRGRSTRSAVRTSSPCVLPAIRQISVDGRSIDPARTMSYKGSMYSGIPNLAFVIGYTNASWTLKCELTCNYVCRLLNHMQRTGSQICVPQNGDPSVMKMPLVSRIAARLNMANYLFFDLEH